MAKILVIDDDALVRAVLTSILEQVGHTVLTAEDGLRGMAMFHEERPDLVITDLVMPEQQGIQTLAKIRGEDPKAKVIVMSGSGRIGDTDFLAEAQALDANDIVAKPFDPEDLLRSVSRCLAE
jgi:CheY-like chemotaxis protein